MDVNYRCSTCLGTTRPIDRRPQKEVQVSPDKLEVVASFCYLRDMLFEAGGCELVMNTRVKTTAWKKLKELLPVLSSLHLSYKTHSRVYMYISCVWNTMLHARETWPLTKPDLQRLRRNARAMIRQTCNVKSKDLATTRSNKLLAQLEIDDLAVILREKRLHWF